MRLNIKDKIILVNMLVLIPIVTVIYILTINNLYQSIINKSIDYLKNESYNSQIYVNNFFNKNSKLEPQTVMKNIAPFISAYISRNLKCKTQIYDSKKLLLGDSNNDLNFKIDEDVSNACCGSKCYKIKKINGERYILFSSPVYVNEESIGCIRYIYSLKEEMLVIKKVIFVMTIIGLIGIFIDLIFSNIFSKKIIKPLIVLKEASQNVTEGIFDDVIKINSNDEIEELANTFNKMSISIKNYIQELKDEKDKQQRFFNNATHQLKTPLTSVIGYSDLIIRLNNDDTINECANYVNKEGKRLLLLIEEILDISRYNKSDMEINKKECNLKDIINECINTLKPRLNMYNININLDIYDKNIYIDHRRTCDVILNIIDNCIKYSECTDIYFIMSENDRLSLKIKDNGQGIDKKDIEKIFEPFFRANKSINKGSGSGLGLSICKTIMELQGGSIFALSEKYKGTEIIITF